MQRYKTVEDRSALTVSRTARQKVKDTEDSSSTAGQVELASVRRAPRPAARSTLPAGSPSGPLSRSRPQARP